MSVREARRGPIALAQLLLLAAGRVAAQAACDPGGPRALCGYNGIPQQECTAKGCCYAPGPAYQGMASYSVPACFAANGGGSSYALSGGANGGNGTLSLASGGALPQLGPDLSQLALTVQNVTDGILRVKIGKEGRWEVPRELYTSDFTTGVNSSGGPLYALSMQNSPFAFTVSRANAGGGGTPLFSTLGSRLVFKDQYIEVTTAIPEGASLYGLGERVSSGGLRLRRDGLPIVLWNRDSAAANPDQNTYGAWPVYMDVREDGQAHGVLLLNSNGMEVVPGPRSLTYRVTGGVLDFYFLLGPTPGAVMDQLTRVMGRPAMPPYWSLGLMNSKYGYGTIQDLEVVTDSYAAAGIPLETFVTDSQYMDHDQDFTFGNTTFPLPLFAAWVAKLHARGQRWVPILDPMQHKRPGLAPYDSGIAQDVFVKDITGQPYLGQLWPGAGHWPDFMKPATLAWWQAQLQGVHAQAPLDGTWLDMNEVSNYCSGDVCTQTGEVPPNNDFVCRLSCAFGPNAGGARSNLSAGIFDPPFKPNSGNSQLNMSEKTLPLSATHHDGTLEYNAHNLYGAYMMRATQRALANIRKRRPFLFSRSTFVGSGAYGAHWTGDTASTWLDLQWSIPNILAAGLAGIPFVGADICGFQNIATEELCARWMNAGAFYPFARLHHAQSFQEAYRWPAVAEVARKALGWRYRLLPYLYTAFWQAHTGGCPVARPLFFAFPGDAAARAVSGQWMMGDGLLVSPVMRWRASSVKAYLPAGTWYDLYTLAAVPGGQAVTLPSNVTDSVPLHVLGGTVIPLGGGGMTTEAARNSSLSLIVAFPQNSSQPPPLRCGGACTVPAGSPPGAGGSAAAAACGAMFLDGGDDLEVGAGADNFLTFSAAAASNSSGGGGGGAGQLFIDWGRPGAAGAGPGQCSGQVQWPALDAVTFLGVAGPVNTSAVFLTAVDGQHAPLANSTSAPLAAGQVAYNASSGALQLTGLNATLACPQGLAVRWGLP